MDLENSKRWIRKEEYLLNYQHQHRGLNFIKLFLPPTIDREVSLTGVDGHIYRGRIPNISEDELPPEIDESSIDEDEIYKDISNMKFPEVPPQDPLGPIRRVDGSHTRKNKLFLAPVKVICENNFEETELLGIDGGIYRGKERILTQSELDKDSGGKKKKEKDKQQNTIEPSIVILQKAKMSMKRPTNVVTIPVINIRKTTDMVKMQNKDTNDRKQRSDKRDFKNKATETETDTGDDDETESTKDSEDSELRQNNTEMEENETDDSVGNSKSKKGEHLEETEQIEQEDVEKDDENNEDEEVDEENEGDEDKDDDEGDEEQEDEGDEDKEDDEEKENEVDEDKEDEDDEDKEDEDEENE